MGAKHKTISDEMHWTEEYQLFLFDFDGLLVNSEEMHYRAYQQMCANYGCQLDWSFARYCRAAHYESDAVRKQLYEIFPELYQRAPSWEVLYAEKKRCVMKLLEQGKVSLMPGVERLLQTLEQADIKRCVVTNSAEDLVRILRDQHPILDTIPYWVTRRDYEKQKPHPESYLKAIEKYAAAGDRIIGFEDTPRGINSLMQTNQAQPVLICRADYPEIPEFLSHGVFHYPSFDELFEQARL